MSKPNLFKRLFFTLTQTVYRYLITLNIMSIKFKHCCSIDHRDYVEAEVKSRKECAKKVIQISIYSENIGSEIIIYLDKKTSIRFAKTIRTEINKMEMEGYNG